MDNKNTGLWLPQEILEREDLTLQEKVVLARVEALDNEYGCFATNDHFSKILGVNKIRVSNIISSLIEKKYIVSSINSKLGNRRVLQKTIRPIIKKDNREVLSKSVIPIIENDNTLLSKTLRPSYPFEQYPIIENAKHNIDINKELNIDINKELEQSEISLEENFIEAKEEKTSTNLEAQKEKKKKRSSAALDSKEEIEIVMPFEHDEFKQKWSLWLTYRKEVKRKAYKSKISEQQALKSLAEDAQQNVSIAIKMIEKAIKYEWQGIFPLKQDEINAITSTGTGISANTNAGFQTDTNKGHHNFNLARAHELVNSIYSNDSPFREVLAYGIPK